MAELALCHPDQPREALDLCRRCYQREWRRRYNRSRGASPMPLRRQEADPIAVERLIAGDPPVERTVDEMTAAVVELTRRGYGRRLIADRLRVTIRTVTRHRWRATNAESGLPVFMGGPVRGGNA